MDRKQWVEEQVQAYLDTGGPAPTAWRNLLYGAMAVADANPVVQVVGGSLWEKSAVTLLRTMKANPNIRVGACAAEINALLNAAQPSPTDPPQGLVERRLEMADILSDAVRDCAFTTPALRLARLAYEEAKENAHAPPRWWRK